MARGILSPAATAPLPKVSFVKIQDDVSTQPAGVHDHQARSYGYNDFSEFRRPEHYIRHIEPLERELAIQVEYDMDEQDQEWLDAVNAERKKEQLNKVSYETFEIIMDRLEKEWFDLTKNIPKPDLALPSEDSTCAICDDSEGENSNAIVFCDGCNLAVHQDCYGVPYIPEGQWLCRKCTVSPENPVSCILCPNEGGAFKQTVLGEWVHLLCAIWVPETRVANDVFMEPITGVDKISKQRWKLKCSICEIRQGASIQCAKTSCFLAFHTTCARREKLLMPMKSTQGSEPMSLTCYCEKHLPLPQREQHEARVTALMAEESGEAGGNKSSKSARAYAKTYKPGPPLVPSLIVDRIMQYIGKVIIRKKLDFLHMMCKYWSLKREARRGAPLLKRLHLEPWTASAGTKHHSEEDKAMKLEHLRRLRKDLGHVHNLVELCRKRESRKLKQAEIVQGIISQCFLPHEPPLRLAFEKIMGLDRQDYFKNPVSRTEVPDYFDIVKHPMCWNTIDAKLDGHGYWDVRVFKRDVQLVLDNAILYNKPGSPFYKAATRIRTSSAPILQELDSLSSSSVVRSGTADDNDQTGADGNLEQQLPFIGDLEPPLHVLELLVSKDALQDNINLILDDDPLASLFNYEFGRFKPPPSPPARMPPRAKPSTKRERKSGQERKRPAKEPDLQEALDVSPGFRAPRTRSAVAAATAFEVEAQGKPGPGPSGEKFSSKRSTKWKRGPMLLPGQSEVPPMVDHIDNQRSFKMFDEGWILPPDQKRGGRAPLERQPIQPPKKRIRTDPGTAPLSVSSTFASENQTLQPGDDEPLQGDSAMGNPDDALNVDEGQLVIQNEAQESTTAVSGSRDPVKSDNIIIIIEELDTPAIRRQKNVRRKAEKLRLAQAAAAAALEHSSALDPVAGPSRVPASRSVGLDSDLSSLSDSDVGEAVERSSTDVIEPNMRSSEARAAIAEEPGAVSFPLEGGTLVWAKADTYPWWPAVIYESDDPVIPKSVLKQGKVVQKRRSGPFQLVQFFDKSSSWQWLDSRRLKHLGDNKGLDEDLLATNSKQQRWKTPAIRQECRSAYRRAISEMETGTDADVDGGGDHGVPSTGDIPTTKELAGVEPTKPTGDVGGPPFDQPLLPIQ